MTDDKVEYDVPVNIQLVEDMTNDEPPIEIDLTEGETIV